MAENIDMAAGEAFNFGGGNPISVRDLVKLISRLYDGQEREPVFHGPKKATPVFKCLDTTKAQQHARMEAIRFTGRWPAGNHRMVQKILE